MTGGKYILLYDGYCGFCNAAVQFIIRHDKDAQFRFAPLLGEYAKTISAQYPSVLDVDSLILVEENDSGEVLFIRSAGALKIAEVLGGWWKVFFIFHALPLPVRDWFYDLFARYRYSIFGKYDSCPLPPPDVRSRFIA